MQTKVLFQQKQCCIFKVCFSSLDRRLLSALTPLLSPGLQDWGNYMQKLNYSVQATPWGLEIFFSPVKYYQLFFLLTLTSSADREVSGGAGWALSGQFLYSVSVQLRCCQVAYRETTPCIYFRTWFHNKPKENLNRKWKKTPSPSHLLPYMKHKLLLVHRTVATLFPRLKCFITLFFMSLTLSCCRKM